MALMKRPLTWILWLTMIAILAGYFIYAFSSLRSGASDTNRIFLPGKTTHGHHQIELACGACHVDPFGGKEVLQNACLNCHEADLKAGDDSHPVRKFTDPRNAGRLEVIDARLCVSCHAEHHPEMTRDMGVTLADDFCFHCHADIGSERPSHQGMDFASCGTAGCHNFHDNRALYEDFLLKHADAPALLENPTQPMLSTAEIISQLANYPSSAYPVKALSLGEADAPPGAVIDPQLGQDWLTTAHARAGVNCTACHSVKSEEQPIARWVDRPDHAVCTTCHASETEGFLESRHGMRLAQGMSPMTPEQGRLPMHAEAAGAELTCTTCHSAHRFDTRKAAFESCVSCHSDPHTQAYEGSPHHQLWVRELDGELAAGQGVSCATCHMPRVAERHGQLTLTLVEHNQNANLRPNEKMIRSTCMSCHGLGFSIDALADAGLVERNFTGSPAEHIESIDMAVAREKD